MGTFLQDTVGDRYHTVMLPTHVAAQDTITYPIFVAPHALTLRNVYAMYCTGITGAGTDTNSINLVVRAATFVATAETEVGAKDFTNGINATQYTREDLLTTEGTAMTAGQVLCVEYEETGTGLAAGMGYNGFMVVWRPA